MSTRDRNQYTLWQRIKIALGWMKSDSEKVIDIAHHRATTIIKSGDTPPNMRKRVV